MKFHLISGLPRSGSTLLAAILRQNPGFHADMSGPLGPLFNAMLAAMGPNNETAQFIDGDQRRRLLRSLFDTFYHDRPRNGVVFDTNRVWTSLLPQVAEVVPDAKVICCVRSLAWVMDSLERLTRENALIPSRLFSSAEERLTVFTRTEALARRDRLVGFAWSALQEAYYGDQSDRLLILEYDILSQRPRETLQLVYRFLDEPWFEHDFQNVEYSREQFDAGLGVPGLHTVRPVVQPVARRSILPPELFRKYSALSFWREQGSSKAARITVEQPAGAAREPPQSTGMPGDDSSRETL
ncbi:MAG: sulfotransferase [Geminicoccaceae bacterium]|nr:sulfotransferase [Geminicoccaceae bacterium]